MGNNCQNPQIYCNMVRCAEQQVWPLWEDYSVQTIKGKMEETLSWG